jgi:hypothetical protein
MNSNKIVFKLIFYRVTSRTTSFAIKQKLPNQP